MKGSLNCCPKCMGTEYEFWGKSHCCGEFGGTAEKSGHFLLVTTVRCSNCGHRLRRERVDPEFREMIDKERAAKKSVRSKQ